MEQHETKLDEHELIEAEFSDYRDGILQPAERKAVDDHLAGCEQCRLAYDEFEQAVSALSDLHKMPAPQNFGVEVEDTIRRRSQGRFFGRKAFGDRIPFEWLAIAALILGLVVYLVIRSSDTGTLKYDGGSKSKPTPQLWDDTWQP